ncbi:MAG: FKBP-type peptidyl-prolyl cis-trans isomerase [Bacteroidetes bacterium]|nr:FKBP-type peptidyl-prolyl cis-trans isomerase [Bacteroidota bacterium]
MNKVFYLLAAAFIVFTTGCQDQRFKKVKGGLEYKIIRGNGDKEIKYGNSIEFKVQQYYNDSLLSNPFDTVPQVIDIDSTKLPAEYVAIFKAAKKGDSIVARISTDTIKKTNALPPFAKDHQYFSYRFKIVNVFTDAAQAEVAKQKAIDNMRIVDSLQKVKQVSIDDKTITDYLAKNNIKAVKTPQGTYVEVQEPGTGEKVDTGKAVTVLYKGMLLDGLVFDQSYDSTGKATKPFTFMIGQPGAIEGWSDGMVYFNKGGKGRLFIPSGRAWGSRGAGADIKPNTPVMFEVTISDVMPKEKYQKEMEAKQKMQQLQQQMLQQMQQQQQNKQQPNGK